MICKVEDISGEILNEAVTQNVKFVENEVWESVYVGVFRGYMQRLRKATGTVLYWGELRRGGQLYV